MGFALGFFARADAGGSRLGPAFHRMHTFMDAWRPEIDTTVSSVSGLFMESWAQLEECYGRGLVGPAGFRTLVEGK